MLLSDNDVARINQNVDINGIDVNINPQSKVKESKVKESNNIYGYYLEKIQPTRKSKQRSLDNIQSHLKRFSEDELLECIDNYFPACKNSEPHFRKDPANFFGKNEPYFKDFLPGKYEEDKPPIPTCKEPDCTNTLEKGHHNGRCMDCHNRIMGFK